MQDPRFPLLHTCRIFLWRSFYEKCSTVPPCRVVLSNPSSHFSTNFFPTRSSYGNKSSAMLASTRVEGKVRAKRQGWCSLGSSKNWGSLPWSKCHRKATEGSRTTTWWCAVTLQTSRHSWGLLFPQWERAMSRQHHKRAPKVSMNSVQTETCSKYAVTDVKCKGFRQEVVWTTRSLEQESCQVHQPRPQEGASMTGSHRVGWQKGTLRVYQSEHHARELLVSAALRC